MIEYTESDKIRLLVSELRQHPIDVVSPNTNSHYYTPSEEALSIAKEIKKSLQQHHYALIRNFSTQTNDALALIKLISEKIYFQGNELGYIHEFETEPFQKDILSSSLESGAFHTDFWSRKDTPNYVAIQCIKPDPRHPYYSRNQVAIVSEVLNTLERLIPGSTKILSNCTLPHRVKDKITWIQLLEQQESAHAIRLHPKYVEENLLKNSHHIKGIPIHKLISEIAQSIAIDFVLNQGDVAIISNKFCLHRRGEASLIFRDNLSKWDSRKINTLRFF